MNEKKKGFNLLPEYVWMIFVGMLLAILILSNVIPGHAGEITPVSGTHSIGFSYESPDHPEYVYTSPFSSAVMLDSQGYYNWLNPPQKVYASDDYGVNYTSVINSTRFANDVKLIKGSVGFDFAGTSLIHVSKANYTGYLPGSVQESWYEDFQEAGYTYFGCDLWAFPSDDISYNPVCIGYMLIKFTDNEIPVLSKVNRVFNTELFQVDFDDSKVVETLTYFNNYAWYVWGFDFPTDADFWASGTQVIYDGLYDHSVENHRIYVKTVNRGDFYFDHVSYNEQYTLNYKYRANVECLDFHREADPEPTPSETEYILFHLNNATYHGYYLIDFEGSGIGQVSASVPVSDSLQSLQTEYNSLSDVALYSTYWNYGTNYANFSLYFNYSTLSSVKVYVSSSMPVDLDYLRSTVTPITLNVVSLSSNTSIQEHVLNSALSYYAGISPSLAPNTFYLGLHQNNSGHNYVVIDQISSGLASNMNPAPDFSATVYYPFGSFKTYQYGLRYRMDFAPYDNPYVSPTPTPSPTLAPLPTSGESIHVIMPTGTPTPTPPFFVSGGSDGGSGSGSGTGSPGSIGSGLSSGQTSGVLQAWQLYVSDNSAMIFLTYTFQSLPQELLYPLYILLFILLLLAVIRLFVHFSGG